MSGLYPCAISLRTEEAPNKDRKAKEPLAERVRRRTFCMIIDHEKTRFKLQPRRTGSISSFTPKSSKTRF